VGRYAAQVAMATVAADTSAILCNVPITPGRSNCAPRVGNQEFGDWFMGVEVVRYANTEDTERVGRWAT
jgi:hypothetical protein